MLMWFRDFSACFNADWNNPGQETCKERQWKFTEAWYLGGWETAIYNLKVILQEEIAYVDLNEGRLVYFGVCRKWN